MKYHILAVLMLGALTGCVEVDSVLTIETDGSGVFEQTVVLSPMAVQMIEGRMSQGLNETPIVSEAEAQQWTKAHPACGVLVESFTAIEQTNAARNVHVKIAYDSLQQLAATDWGYALQLAVTNQGDAVVVSLDDPVRTYLLGQTLGQNGMATLSPAREADQQPLPKDPATLDMMQRAARGLTSRVAVNLPVSADDVAGAQLVGGGKLVETRGGTGDTVASLRVYAASPRVAISVPDAKVKWAAFPRLLSIAPQQSSKPLVHEQALTNFICEIRSIEINNSRRLEVNQGAVQTNTTAQFNVQLSVLVPAGIRARRDDSFRMGQKNSGFEISVVDETGKDLATEHTYLYFNPEHRFGNRYMETNRVSIGSISIDGMDLPSPEVKHLSRLTGGVNILIVLEESELVVKPLAANLRKEYPLPDGTTLTFTEIKDRRILYEIAGQPKMRTPDIEITLFAPDGTQLKNTGYGGRGSDNHLELDMSFSDTIPEGVYAVVRYPSKVVSSWIPFSFTDVELP